MIGAMKDRSLVERAQTGDAAAFTQLLRNHDDAMRAVAYRMLGSQTAMDDVLQTAYLKAYRSLDRFRAEASFSTWLHRIVVNCCYDHHRSAGRRQEVPLNEALAVPAKGSHEDRLADSQQLHLALQSLQPDHRAIVLLVDGEGLSYQEAASVLGIEQGTVASRLSRARSELRRRLQLPEETIR